MPSLSSIEHPARSVQGSARRLTNAGWRVLSAFMPGGSDADARLHRIGYIVSAIVYITFAITAIALARRASTDANGNEQVTDITSPIMSNAAGRWLIGLVGVIVIAVGFFLLRAAVTYHVNEATGLDGALRRLATSSWGVDVVFVVGIGFAAYGIFCLATFAHRRLEAP